MRHIINLTIIWVTYKPVGLFPLGQRLAEAAPPSYSTCLLQPRPILPWLFLAIFVSFPTAHITALAILDQFVFLATFYTSILLLSLFKPPLKWLSVVSNLTIFFTFRTAHTSLVFLDKLHLCWIHLYFSFILTFAHFRVGQDILHLLIDSICLLTGPPWKSQQGFFTLLR